MLLNVADSRWTSALVVLGSLLCLATLRCEAQNLVPNPSFEEVDSCPEWPVLLNYTPGARPKFWYSCSDSPEYFNACVDTMTGVPSNLLTYQPAFDGVAYSGMFTYTASGEYREMIGTELLSPLDSGQTYYVSFRANAAFGGELHWITRATDNIGALFTMEADEWVFGDPVFGFRDYAHMYSTAVINDTSGWTLVSGSFVADSAYRYLVIGNHFRDSTTTLAVLDPDTPLVARAYTLVDDVCVSPDAQGCPLVNGLNDTHGRELIIAPNPADAAIEIVAGSMVASIRIIDLTGKVVFSEDKINDHRLRIDVSAFSPGIYVVIVGQGRVEHRKKFVVL